MAAILCALGYCIHSVVMSHKEEKQKRQQQADSPFSSATTTHDEKPRPHRKHESLREKVMRKIHGKGVNPSQLGDPVSLKAETSSTLDPDDASGATTLRGSEEGSDLGGGGRHGREGGGGLSDGRRDRRSSERRTTRREQAVGGNPSMLGDPTSIKAETSDRALNAEEEDASTSTTKSKL